MRVDLDRPSNTERSWDLYTERDLRLPLMPLLPLGISTKGYEGMKGFMHSALVHPRIPVPRGEGQLLEVAPHMLCQGTGATNSLATSALCVSLQCYNYIRFYP